MDNAYPSKIILIVDDTALMRAMHKKYLIALGVDASNIYECEDGQKGFIKLDGLVKENRKPDLIICDWDMPIMTGLDFLKKLRMFPPTKAISFLMVTGHDKPEDFAKVTAAGVSAVLMKPIKIDAYNKKVVELLGKE